MTTVGDIASSRDFNKAQGAYRQALDILAVPNLRKFGAQEMEVKIQYKLGNLLSRVRLFDEAEHFLDQVIEVLKNKPDNEDFDLELYGKALMKRAVVRFERGYPDKAFRDCDEAFALYSEQSVRQSTKLVFSKLGAAASFRSELLWRLGEYESAARTQLVSVVVAYNVFKASGFRKVHIERLARQVEIMQRYRSAHGPFFGEELASLDHAIDGVAALTADKANDYEEPDWLSDIEKLVTVYNQIMVSLGSHETRSRSG